MDIQTCVMGFVRGVHTSEINVATRTVNNAITIKTKVLLTQRYVILTDFGYPVYFGIGAPKHLDIAWLSIIQILSVPDEGYSERT